MHHLHQSLAAAALLAGPLFGLQTLEFGFEELTLTGHPEHPGILFERHPVSIFAAEAGGAATVDFDEDGDLDVFLTDTESWPNHLYVNQGDGTFDEQAQAYGVDEPTKRRGSALFFELDNDGDLDLLTLGYPSQVVLNLDLYTLFRNDGAPGYGFTDITSSVGGFVHVPTPEATLIGEPGGVTSGDIDGDSYSDVFVTWWNRSTGYLNDQPRMWRNLPNTAAPAVGQTDYSTRVLQDFTIQAGFAQPIGGWIWTPTLIDVDRDGDLDMHINVDFGLDVLRLNNGSGVFGPNICTEVGWNGTPEASRNEMGIAFGDIDFDGDLDTYQTNFDNNDRQYINRSDLSSGGVGLLFEDVAPSLGTAVSTVGWGAAYLDLDHDRDLDLLSMNGMGVPAGNWFFENRWPEKVAPGGPVLFAERSAELGDYQTPAGIGDIARNLAPFDFDGDGDLDLLVGRYGTSSIVSPGPRAHAALWRNTLDNDNGWLQLRLYERQGSRMVTGARVHLRSGLELQSRIVTGGGTSFLTQEPYRQHFGLGDKTLYWVAIRWFDGSVQVIESPAPNQVLRVDRAQKNQAGDVNGDGLVNSTDVTLLARAINRPKSFDAVYGFWPWQITGDLDGNGVVEAADLALLDSVVP
jgi:enediyne biosynthesis protein E4